MVLSAATAAIYMLIWISELSILHVISKEGEMKMLEPNF